MTSRSFTLNLQQDGTNKTLRIPVSQEQAIQYSYTLNVLSATPQQNYYYGDFEGGEPILIGVESTKSSSSTAPVGISHYYEGIVSGGGEVSERSRVTNYLKYYLSDSCTHIVSIYPNVVLASTRGTFFKVGIRQNESGKEEACMVAFPKYTIQSGPGDHNVIYLESNSTSFSPSQLELPIEFPTHIVSAPPTVMYESVFPTFCPMELEMNEVSGRSINGTLRLSSSTAKTLFTSPSKRSPVPTPSPLHVGNVVLLQEDFSDFEASTIVSLIPIYIYLS